MKPKSERHAFLRHIQKEDDKQAQKPFWPGDNRHPIYLPDKHRNKNRKRK